MNSDDPAYFGGVPARQRDGRDPRPRARRRAPPPCWPRTASGPASCPRRTRQRHLAGAGRGVCAPGGCRVGPTVTYSIVARDPDTGEMGVATQSQAFAVGNSVPFALPGHGVIATQSMAEPMYGSVGLDLLQGGFTAQEVLTALSSVDPQPQRRQVAVLGVNGDLAAYTGDSCVDAAGHLHRRHLRRAGQHGRLAAGVGDDGRAVRELRGPARPAAAQRAAGGGGGRRRLPGTALGRDHGHPGDHHRPALARHGGRPPGGRLARSGRPRWPTCWSPAPATRTSSAPSSRRSTATRSPPTASSNCCADGPGDRARPADVAGRGRGARRPGGRRPRDAGRAGRLRAAVPRGRPALRQGRASCRPTSSSGSCPAAAERLTTSRGAWPRSSSSTDEDRHDGQQHDRAHVQCRASG